MSDAQHIVCPHCTSVNRVPLERFNDQPKCGACHRPLFVAEPIALNEANFQRHIENSDLPVVVDFWAPWCGPCKMMAPVFAQAAAQFNTRLRLAKVNTQEIPTLASRYDIRGIPTLVIFKKGREVERLSGALSASQLTAWLQRQL